MGGGHRGGPYSGGKYFAPFKNPQLKPESPAGEHLPTRLARETNKFIDDNKDGPFLAYLAFYSVHTPLMGRPDLVEKYKKKAAAITGKEFGTEEQVFGKEPRKVRILQKHPVYGAMVEAMDEAIGTVLTHLKESGLDENTVVIFTSDNGGLATSEGLPTSNLPLRGGKGWVYEGGIRVPWIVRFPGVTKPDTTSAELISSIDLFPTLTKAADIPVNQTIDGIDLMPALMGEELPSRSLYWHYPHYSNQGGIPGGAIRDGNYKLFERYEDGRVELFDLKKDIGEQNDLAKSEPERVEKMRASLHEWYQDLDAKFLQRKKKGPRALEAIAFTQNEIRTSQTDWFRSSILSDEPVEYLDCGSCAPRRAHDLLLPTGKDSQRRDSISCRRRRPAASQLSSLLYR